MKRIALTGGIACGKSSLADFLAACGCEVWDADEAVHALEAPGGEAVAPILAAFGQDVRTTDGGIHRARLGQTVFADKAARQRLNGIVHPLVRREFERWLALPGNCPKVAVIPLLFEVGWEKGWDSIVCVACAGQEQLRRLQARGLSAVEAHARLSAQLPLSEKVRLADRVVWNDGDLPALQREALQLRDEWTEKQT